MAPERTRPLMRAYEWIERGGPLDTPFVLIRMTQGVEGMDPGRLLWQLLKMNVDYRAGELDADYEVEPYEVRALFPEQDVSVYTKDGFSFTVFSDPLRDEYWGCCVVTYHKNEKFHDRSERTPSVP